IGAAVFSDFVPDQIRLVLEAPSRKHSDSIREQSIGYPQIKMASTRCSILNWQSLDLFKSQGAIPLQTLMLGSNFACTILKLPRRICKNRAERSTVEEVSELSRSADFFFPAHNSSPNGCCRSRVRVSFKASARSGRG